jgi:hypothetical protein
MVGVLRQASPVKREIASGFALAMTCYILGFRHSLQPPIPIFFRAISKEKRKRIVRASRTMPLPFNYADQGCSLKRKLKNSDGVFMVGLCSFNDRVLQYIVPEKVPHANVRINLNLENTSGKRGNPKQTRRRL